MRQRYNVLVGLVSAFVFSLLYIMGFLNYFEERLYDFFLSFRADRPRIENVAFLDADDPAIAYYGVFPWPRSIVAEGILRLKEYGAAAAIFDIEYIDQGPQGIDSLYLNQGLGNDFNRSFSDINAAAQEIISAITSGRINRSEIEHYSASLNELIAGEQKNLFSKAQRIARDNDIYLAQAQALNGRSWSTLNLREELLEGEQAERRVIAEEHFAYPVKAAEDAHKGAGFVDILPSLPMFAEAAKGAGFTNVEIDSDGVRRRVYLAQNIKDHWYLQLSFSPLLDYLGNPEIILEEKKLTIKQAKFPDGRIKDIVIPLDHKGRMMLDWPKEDYADSYDHVSFAQFSVLDDIEADIEYYSRALAGADLMFFSQFDSVLSRVIILLGNLGELFDAARTTKNNALENTSEDYFNDYLKYRGEAYSLLGEIIALNADTLVTGLAEQLSEEYPESAEYIYEEADYIFQLIGALRINLDDHNKLNAENKNMLKDKFVIMGYTGTGTTDYGATPFYEKYINVGTHGVVLDTILSESFLIPLGHWWRAAFLMIFIPFFFFFTSRFVPVVRAVSGFGAALVIFAGAVLLFRFTGIYWGPLGAVLAMFIAVITREVIAYAGSEKEKQFIRTAFSTYVSSDVVKEIISDPSRLQLGGTKRYMTALFTDIKGFSSISEKLDPVDLVNLLNHYLSAMSDIVLEEKGTIDKYIGDAIVAFFGAPLVLEDHALRACISAIKMKKIEEELNKTFAENNMSPMPVFTRFGVNTGYMVAGNMGTGNKMNYTIMGNAVNLSARLEAVNKQYGTQILASEYTVREAAKTSGEKLLYRKLDRVRVVGINEPVRLCELLDTIEEAGDQNKKLVTVFHEALDNFENRNWKQAEEGFKEALAISGENDAPAKMYLKRIEQFLTNPPDKKWDGVYNLTSK